MSAELVRIAIVLVVGFPLGAIGSACGLIPRRYEFQAWALLICVSLAFAALYPAAHGIGLAQRRVVFDTYVTAIVLGAHAYRLLLVALRSRGQPS